MRHVITRYLEQRVRQEVAVLLDELGDVVLDLAREVEDAEDAVAVGAPRRRIALPPRRRRRLWEEEVLVRRGALGAELPHDLAQGGYILAVKRRDPDVPHHH